MEVKNKTDEELVDATLNVSAKPSIEMMRRLKNSMNFSSGVMIVLTLVLIVFTAILIWQGLS